jgi:hypothetical protein
VDGLVAISNYRKKFFFFVLFLSLWNICLFLFGRFLSSKLGSFIYNSCYIFFWFNFCVCCSPPVWTDR